LLLAHAIRTVPAALSTPHRAERSPPSGEGDRPPPPHRAISHEGRELPRRCIHYASSRGEVRRLLTAAIRAQDERLHVGGDRVTFATFLGDWLATVKSAIRPPTVDPLRAVRPAPRPADPGRLQLGKLDRRHLQGLSPGQARVLLVAAEDDRLGTLYVVALTTAMREGEHSPSAGGTLTCSWGWGPPQDRLRDARPRHGGDHPRHL
jgi:hypothetical protein